MDLEETRKQLDLAAESLKEVERNVNMKLLSLTAKEKELDAFEKELLDRENAGLQKLAEQRKVLDAEKHKFAVEINRKRKSVDEELNSRITDMEERENAGNQLQENLLRKEAEVDQMRAEIEEEKQKMREEPEWFTREEKLKLVQLQSELEHEINQFRLKKEKEAEALKQEKEKLDKKQSEIEKELADLKEQKESFEKIKHYEEENLRKLIQRECNALKQSKESFAASMEHEQKLLLENIQNAKRQMVCDFEHWKSQLQNELQRKQQEMLKQLQEREKLVEEKEIEVRSTKCSREMARRDMEATKLERLKLESNHIAICKDIDELENLRRNMKAESERFMKERGRFVGFVNKIKSCGLCREMIGEFVLSDLQSLSEVEKPVVLAALPKSAYQYLKEGVQQNVATSDRQDTVVPAAVSDSRFPNASSPAASCFQKCISKVSIQAPVVTNELSAPILMTNIAAESMGINEAIVLTNSPTDPQQSIATPGDTNARKLQTDLLEHEDSKEVEQPKGSQTAGRPRRTMKPRHDQNDFVWSEWRKTNKA